MRFLFLYTELAEYVLACCQVLSRHGDVHIVRWPVNKEAPFQFKNSNTITLYSKTDYSFEGLKELVHDLNPDMIVCSGWIDKEYLKITKSYFGKIPTVMTCDTHWRGDLKQYLAAIISRFTLLRIFSHAWVPGNIQKRYVLNLGFKMENVQTGFYCCDLPYFESLYQTQFIEKQHLFPKRFLFVGRYYDFKGIKELWQAFAELQEEQSNDWELWCLGTGDIEPVKHPKIKHFGFVQPKDLAAYTAQTGVFILPSRYEPWGVVVQEFAASGFPLLLSDQVGSKELFLNPRENGLEFKAGNIAEIKKAMQEVIDLSDEALKHWGKTSHEYSKRITPETWVKTLMKFMPEHPNTQTRE